jgi:hypothetical protein
VVLAALGERDEDVAKSSALPLDAAQCSIARRQAKRVLLQSLATGLGGALVLWLLLGPR